jgi:hypothetical protein
MNPDRTSRESLERPRDHREKHHHHGRKSTKKNKDKRKSAKKSNKKKKEQQQEIMIREDVSKIKVGHYQMLEAIGKGGFGTVYRGLNLRSGKVVAVKRVALHGIPKEELEGIEVRGPLPPPPAPFVSKLFR